MRGIAAVVLGLVLLVVGSAPCSAQASDLIFGGEPIVRDLKSAEVHQFTFIAGEREAILIRASRASGELWPLIRVYGPDGKVVGEPVRGNPTAEQYLRVPTGGRYSILISDGYNGSLTGRYVLAAQNLTVPVGAPSCDPGTLYPIKLGLAAMFTTCTFMGCEGDLISIRASRTGGDLWPVLRLYGPAGDRVGEPERGNPTAELIVRLPAKGRFSVVLCDGYNGALTGEANLILTQIVKSETCPEFEIRTPPATSGCRSATGEVRLYAPAPAGGATILLGATGPASVREARLTVPAGQRSASFTIDTQPQAVETLATITGTMGGVSKSTQLIVLPVGVGSVVIQSASVKGDATITLTASLECAAAPADVLLTLSSSNPEVAFPSVSNLLVPRDRTSEAFTVNLRRVTVETSVTIYATANGSTRGVELKVSP